MQAMVIASAAFARPGAAPAPAQPLVSRRCAPRALGGGAPWSAPFAGVAALPQPVLQDYLRADILRRSSELTLLGWLGRAYLTPARPLLDALLPRLFELTPYDAGAAACYDDGLGRLDVTLRERSVGGAKGIPFRLELRAGTSGVTAARLLAIGCDLTREDAASASAEGGAAVMSAGAVDALCESLRGAAPKRLVVRAIVAAIFTQLAPVAEAAKARAPLRCVAPPASFTPREEHWALEGSSHKWVQQVSGYYFAASALQDVGFAPAGGPAGEPASPAVRFTFYLDEAEPLNSDDPTRNVNPEVVNCVFGD